MGKPTRCLLAALALLCCACMLAACNPLEAPRRMIQSLLDSGEGDAPPPVTDADRPTPTPASGGDRPLPQGKKGMQARQGTAEGTDQPPENFGDMTDQDLIDHLLSELPDVNELVTGYGMKLLVTGETSLLEGEGLCRDIWLGTELAEGKFTREILFTVSESGEIFRYNALEDLWERPNSDTEDIMLAYIMLGEILEDGLVQFYVDEVRWIADEGEPNGYAIVNDRIQWVPYTADLWTQCFVWVEAADGGMDYFQVSLDNFLEELQGYPEGMLVEIHIEEDHLWLISHQYTP